MWPGQACTYLGNNIWKWTYTGSDKISGGVIFNNGSSQTQDLTWVNGGYYNANGYVKTIDGAGEIPDNPDVDEPTGNEYVWTAYYRGTNWGTSTVYTYVWDAGNANKQYLGAWPGAKMSKNADGVWEVSFTTTDVLITPMIIFNNGQGGGSNQTADLSFINNGIYEFDGYKGVGVERIEMGDAVEVARYDIYGRQLAAPALGINIVQYSNGVVKKVIVR